MSDKLHRLALLVFLCSSAVAAGRLNSPALELVENALLTTAKDDFKGHVGAFEAAATWNGERLRHSQEETRAPHLACARYGDGHEASSRLKQFLSPEAVRVVSHSEDHGACFFASASHAQAAAIVEDQEQFGLENFSPFPSPLKLAPGLVDHTESHDEAEEEARSSGLDRLSARHGARMRKPNVEGLSVELTPGTLAARSSEAKSFINHMLGDLMSASVDLHSTNFWSDPGMDGAGEHLSSPAGAVRARDWRKAASVVHELSEAASTGPGDICSWNRIFVHHAGDDSLLVSGLDHLLFSGRGAGGSHEEESTELHVACFMGLVSFLAGRPEVLRVSPRPTKRVLNAAARGVIQSASATDTPLTDAGLDGTGEIIQVIDSGLDETSCYFIDDSGEEVDHGYYFDELGRAAVYSSSYSSDETATIFNGGDFSYYPERRKAGHGTHTAGSAAGATLNDPAETITCNVTDTLSCVGACIDLLDATDDLVSISSQTDGTDLDRLCPMYGCDNSTDTTCLSDDVPETLSNNGGMAQGAKLAIFDVFYGGYDASSSIGNNLWEVCTEAGCKLHSNSLGADFECSIASWDILNDQFMYENAENLLIFAAGNEGGIERSTCTINTPGIGKNSLAIGASTSGDTRVISTVGATGIDTVAEFSSWGFTTDDRIKPEVVAPGDSVYSAASDGTDTHSCRLWAYEGTSMSCPIVAGAAAMIRQYFVDETFYTADVTARGFCSDGFICEGFSPSAATVKALLINSANLMGGSSEPDGFRGFGRVHLEAGMPLEGEGDLVLFVADALDTSIAGGTLEEYLFDVDADAGLDLRATLSWIDPPATATSAVQLVHNLDLVVVSPDGTTYRMWGSDTTDNRNVNERVIVDATDVVTGTWTVWVWANNLVTDSQSYSLVVNGAISPGTGEGASGSSSFEVSSSATSASSEDGTGAGVTGGSLVAAPAAGFLAAVVGACVAAMVAAGVFVA
ncbi:Peptidase S8 and S53, subtilisin, kexin, sedolisin [Ectocarpus siliculosus]|uniref:subtilisin n=1 Tax=Ectocarpus siliculosus TaxID=2880 RepID=D8LNG6_ECTSI|nr:Peptidase S8 and S53, subtilisin, kexin, sedolisin [Ectocarpus siliculosus]|eukprot:CBN77323.1 Peptidase S8 and S53, subtilisin, kexin, sedolisin [Ectocarpus siliculosus]